MTDPAPPAPAPSKAPEAAPASRIGSLYVADLAPTVTESNLYDFFRAIGQNAIASIRVCRDTQTQKSLGYAYVNFHRAEDADRAIDVLNYEPIEGRPCRISWSRRDPSLRKSGVGNVFIKNLAKDIDHLGLFDTFSNFGEIISCKVATDFETGESKGYGFVHFSTSEEAEKAIAALNGKCLNKKQVYVGPFVPRHMRDSGETKDNFTNIYIKHISPSVTPEQFVELVTKATADIGPITSPKLMTKTVEKDGATVEESLRFGFANFESHEAAQKALDRFADEEKMKELVPELIAEGQVLYAAAALPKAKRQQMFAEKRPQNLNLYVKNIAESVTEEQLNDLFKKFGNITSVKIMFDEETKANKGFGFVCFETTDAAAAALAEMNGARVENKPLYVAIAQPKAVRRQQLAQHYSGRMNMPPQNMNMMGYGFYPNMPRFNTRNPAFRGRPPMPGGFAGPAGRGVPFQMRPPQFGPPTPNMVPGGAPMPMPVGAPVASDDGKFIAEFIEQIPEENRTQTLGDMLYKKIIAEEQNEFESKKIVGTILSKTQSMNPQQTLDYLIGLCRNDAQRKAAVQQAKNV